MKESRLLRSAIEYVKIGWSVFPLKERSKSPATAHGVKDATTDIAQIKRWWKRNPNYNIGIACGSKSNGLLVIDLDIDEDKGLNGYSTLRDWERENGSLPDTIQSITGRGGYQLFYRSDKVYKNSVGLMDGIDVRSSGGYIVAPPSIHPNGNEYRWEYWIDDFDGVTPFADETVEKLLLQQDRANENRFTAPSIINSSERNNTLFRIASSLQSKGLSDEAILAAIREENRVKCLPPISDAEVVQIVNSALKYEKGSLISFNFKNEVVEGIPEPVWDVGKNGKIKMTIHNCYEAINCDANFHGKIMLNELTQSAWLIGEYPWKRPSKILEWTDSDDKQMYQYIEENYGLTNKENIDIALTNIANSNSFNPVIDKLEECYEKYQASKKEGYIRKLLTGFLGADDTDYTYEVMKLVLLGAICRAYHPGCKFDYVMILYGSQGIGKSTFIRFLAMNDEWVNDNFNSVDPKIGAENLRGVWIAEMAELLAAKRAKEVEQVKSFITSTKDTFRAAFGKRSEPHYRRSIFIGTTNDPQFLTDSTGNRRFLPIEVDKSKVTINLFGDKEKVNELFELAWGEAMELFKNAGEFPALILPKTESDRAEEMQQKFTEENPIVGLIGEYLDSLPCDSRVCVMELYENALKGIGAPPIRMVNEIHSIMQTMRGWIKYPNKIHKARCGKYGVQRCYLKVGKELPENNENEATVGNSDDGFVEIKQEELPFD